MEKAKEKKVKKPFGETKFAGFLKKAGSVIKDKGGDLIAMGVKAYSGDFAGAFGELKEALGKEDTPEAKQLISDLDINYKRMLLEFEKEIYALEVKDRSSAREREVGIAQTGRTDIMMIVAGVIGLGSFVFIIVAIVYKPELQDNKLLIHILGMVEVVSTAIFFYYFGSSKGSADKNKLL